MLIILDKNVLLIKYDITVNITSFAMSQLRRSSLCSPS